MSLVNKICKSSKSRLCLFLTTLGPGMIVMLADTDAGSIVTAAQSGAIWRYKLLIIQLILIPFLFITQELTVRLGISTKKGYSELIKQEFGFFWAFISVFVLAVCCIGAIITELSGIASVGALFGIPNWLSMIISITFLTWLILTKSYLTVERIALIIGAFELVYLFVAWQAQPNLNEILQDLTTIPLYDKNYLYLCAANIGAVIMPWMIFYQQSAVVDKKLGFENLPASRLETILGAVITQIIMIAVVIAVAATIGTNLKGQSLNDIQQISNSITPFLGNAAGKILFALGMLGASLVATIVVSLSLAWSIGEIYGFRRSLQDKPKEAPWFYGIYFVILTIGGLIVATQTKLIHLNIAIEVLNALLLPVVLFFLFALACKVRSKQNKLNIWYKIILGISFLSISLISLYSGIKGI